MTPLYETLPDHERWKGVLPHGRRFQRFLQAGILLVLFAAAIFLRFYRLGAASLWVDEANTVYSAKAFAETGESRMPSGFIIGRDPAYTYTVALVYTLFGISEESTRVTAAVFGVACVLMAAFLAGRLFNRRVGLATAFLLTFSNFDIGWSRTARMYTLFQLVTLVTVWLFATGFESDNRTRISRFWKGHALRSQGIVVWRLLLCLALLACTFLYVHRLAIFTAAGMLAYVTVMAARELFRRKEDPARSPKYAVILAAALLGAAVLWFTVPGLKESIRYFIGYVPPWAAGMTAGSDRLALFGFLIDPLMFPLAAFFYIGSVQIFTAMNRRWWIPVFLFAVPLFLLSFIFGYRVPVYLFHLYPFFLMTAAFGFVRIMEYASAGLQKSRLFRNKWMQWGLLLLYPLIFVISPWFRASLNIPFLEDGVTNTAVTPDEWREACRILNEERKEGDIVITSLPIVALYYGIKSDYGLNMANLEQAKKEKTTNDRGEWVDVYAGVRCIETADALRDIVASHARGWLAVSVFHMEHAAHVPPEIQSFIQNTLIYDGETKNRTVQIYHWAVERKR